MGDVKLLAEALVGAKGDELCAAFRLNPSAFQEWDGRFTYLDFARAVRVIESLRPEDAVGSEEEGEGGEHAYGFSRKSAAAKVRKMMKRMATAARRGGGAGGGGEEGQGDDSNDEDGEEGMAEAALKRIMGGKVCLARGAGGEMTEEEVAAVEGKVRADPALIAASAVEEALGVLRKARAAHEAVKRAAVLADSEVANIGSLLAALAHDVRDEEAREKERQRLLAEQEAARQRAIEASRRVNHVKPIM